MARDFLSEQQIVDILQTSDGFIDRFDAARALVDYPLKTYEPPDSFPVLKGFRLIDEELDRRHGERGQKPCEEGFTVAVRTKNADFHVDDETGVPKISITLFHAVAKAQYNEVLAELIEQACPKLFEASVHVAPRQATPDNAVNRLPAPVATGHLAFCFSGLKWSEEKWKNNLANQPKWLKACVHTPGVRGKTETLWNPVLIGGALVSNGHAKQRSVRSRFQTQLLLKPWLDDWKTYEADNFDSE